MTPLTAVALSVVLGVVILVAALFAWLAWGTPNPVAPVRPAEQESVVAPVRPGYVKCICYGEDGQHSLTHRIGDTHPQTLRRPHGRAPATTYTLVDVHDRVGVYQEMTR